MPKQGQFAKSSRLKQLNQFKVKKHSHRSVIDGDQFVDYVVLRFNLTSKKRLAKKIQESNQRFLIEILDTCQGQRLDLESIIPSLFKQLNSRVPWQFYRQIINGWRTLQHFIQREVPSVPLKQQILVSGTISEEELTKMVAEELAVKATAMMFLNRPVSNQIQKLTQQRLFQTIYQGDQVNWQQIEILFKPFPLVIAPGLDQETKDWLIALAKS
ncbi:hypothetical protein [Limosilactobacillus fastidiosus]|uniref:Uncharacterized protein n=1 Tax=Limosilactobacillus fastidiosus TaxID=2759855 RepID=A0A7W3U015_9LACO|nr:hypothetical protein [Limosilactobacillus fastidiosus]MBB1062877.1 hypothetical protein [Limosilactobacillus fastidiosus]MBB1086454.1 hypothetical protein [Limosilactobacillus fastidiosus]MCD7084095.1 hypothetical protein [Limosilactobacillus fastidiosus]MCD7086334.1 hypothetical protein [Limosilactobacillus fastidiosus]MCD7114885.1 hypothetical protein [Limosilactobacillus fastidiosus]